jgi:DNA-binding GntR family transcriptional regulator
MEAFQQNHPIRRRMSIATFIKHDLIANIRSGEINADQLTLDALSKQYQVSTRPVRTVMRELIEEKYIEKKNGRFAIRSKRRTGAVSPPPQPVDLGEVIGKDLIELSLKGDCVLLREETIAEKYGTSRTTIRQIFQRLAGKGILKHLPRRGWQLRPFRQKDLGDYIDMRANLELMALTLAWPRLVDEELQAMLDRNVLSAGPKKRPSCDNSLHAYFIEKSDNRFISDFFDRHGKYYDVLFSWESLDREAQIQAVQQHREILQALLRRDRGAAERALKNHIHNNHPILLANRPKPDATDTH